MICYTNSFPRSVAVVVFNLTICSDDFYHINVLYIKWLCKILSLDIKYNPGTRRILSNYGIKSQYSHKPKTKFFLNWMIQNRNRSRLLDLDPHLSALQCSNEYIQKKKKWNIKIYSKGKHHEKLSTICQKRTQNPISKKSSQRGL